MAKLKIRRFEGGGDVDAAEAADKQAGLDASNKEEPVGFFARLRMGNIDDPNSEAYAKFGAGRGKSLRTAAVKPEPEAETPSVELDPMEAANNSKESQDIAASETPGPKVTKLRNLASTSSPSKPPKSSSAYKDDTAQLAQKYPSPSSAASSSSSKDETERLAQKYPNKSSSTPSAKESWETPTKEQSDWRKKAESSQALENVYPEELLIGGAAVAPLKALFRGRAMKTADEAIPVLKRLTDQGIPIPEYIQTLLPRQAKRFLTEGAKDVTDVVPKRISMAPRRLSAPESAVPAGREEVLNKSFWVKGPAAKAKPKSKKRKPEPTNMKAGGFVRADGKAQRGRTKGRFV